MKKERLVIDSVSIGDSDSKNKKDLRYWSPENEDIVFELVHIYLREKRRSGLCWFLARIATPEGLKAELKQDLKLNNGIMCSRWESFPLIVMDRYDFDTFWQWLNEIVSTCEAETMAESVENLKRYFQMADWYG
jgi:hypothetical protein